MKNQTTDGYVLAVGFDKTVLGCFAQHKKVKSRFQTLRDLMANDLPQTIKQKGILFDEDKDFLAVYLCAVRFWVTCRTEEQARLIKIILDRAWSYSQSNIKQIFNTWLIAIQEAIQ